MNLAIEILCHKKTKVIETLGNKFDIYIHGDKRSTLDSFFVFWTKLFF